MTELLTRSATASGPAHERATGAAEAASGQMWWRGCLSALWVTSVGCAALVVTVLVAWAADSRSGAGATSAIRTALQLWLAGHRVPLRVAGGSVVVAPLGLTMLLAWLVARAAAVLARGQEVDTARGVGLVALAVGVPYAVLTTFVAAAAHSASVRPDPATALADGLLLGLLGSAWGAARGVGLVRQCWSLLPEPAARVVAGGAAAAGVLVAGGLLLVLLGLVTHAATAASMVTALGGGAVGAGAVVLLCLALLPNAALAAVGYLSGPGFAVGAGTGVSLGSVHAGSVPALPLLAAVPQSPAGAAVELAVLATLVGAGIAAAAVVARLGQPLLRTMGWAAACGVAAGAVAMLLTAVAGGSAGPGRMSAIGASPWQTGLAVAAEVAVVAVGAAGAMTWRRGR
ncbi:MAG TPA: DUF6350 family protein [Mycobacteriales bacterium]|nr:DUF6350 family protein [Mycobacteriales bacterium]